MRQNEVSAIFIFMLAVIKTGGKQYLAAPGQKIKVEKLNVPEGGSILFDEVLLVADGDTVDVGMPRVAGARVEAKVLRQGRARKVIVFKYRPKARWRKKKGHRQHYTEVEIGSVISGQRQL